MIFISLLIHFISYILLNEVKRTDKKSDNQQKIKVKFVKKPISKKDSIKKNKKEDPALKQIIESKLAKTLPPEKSSYLGAQDHIAKKPMKTKKNLFTKNQKTPITKKQIKDKNIEKKAEKNHKRKPNVPKSKKSIAAKTLKKAPKARLDKNSNSTSKSYTSYLQNSFDLLNSKNNNPYRDYIDDDTIEDGDVIDLSTKEYRYIGYFTNLRRAIELAWVYPAIAVRRGNQGKVILKFTIHKNGKVSNIELLSSSGYQVLDKSIMDAIKLAGPFPPLPKSFQKSNLTISGSFTYLLSNYAGGN